MELPERESMAFDVVVVGAGPAGLSTAIRLKQLAAEKGAEVSVVVVEKGSEVGAHILSGAVIDPIGLDRLVPDWREDPERPLTTEVARDEFLYLTATRGLRMPQWPMPRLMSNHGNFIGSLGDVCRYLGRKAEELGVEIYPGFPAAEVLVDGESRVVGVATGDLGIGRDGKPKDSFTRGMELRGRYTVFAEGARGNLTKQLIHRFSLDRGRDHQKYGIGIKELWQVAPEKHKPGLVQHSMGWPLPNHAGGGSWLYHFGDNLVSVGFVIHLNYQNPTLSPFDEFQRFKTHPSIRRFLEGGKRIAYGARAVTEGGYQSVPKLSFPGGALLGCSAGFMNVPRIKGSHNAVKSGIMAAEAAAAALAAGRAGDELTDYDEAYKTSWVAKELRAVRNFKPLWSKLGTIPGIVLGGADATLAGLLGGFSFFGTMRHTKSDAEATGSAKDYDPIVYPKPDGVLSFDKLSSVFLSGNRSRDDGPNHIRVRTRVPREVGRTWEAMCPAGVYELRDAGGDMVDVELTPSNCVQCGAITAKGGRLTPPEGGSGPEYTRM
ncbi:MAG: 4Fe-4S dicluster domain-containing protein [Microvirga sp.]